MEKNVPCLPLPLMANNCLYTRIRREIKRCEIDLRSGNAEHVSYSMFKNKRILEGGANMYIGAKRPPSQGTSQNIVAAGVGRNIDPCMF